MRARGGAWASPTVMFMPPRSPVFESPLGRVTKWLAVGQRAPLRRQRAESLSPQYPTGGRPPTRGRASGQAPRHSRLSPLPARPASEVRAARDPAADHCAFKLREKQQSPSSSARICSTETGSLGTTAFLRRTHASRPHRRRRDAVALSPPSAGRTRRCLREWPPAHPGTLRRETTRSNARAGRGLPEERHV